MYSTVPLASRDGSLDGFVEDTSLYEVLNGEVELLLAHQPVTPLFLKVHDMGGEGSTGEIHGFAESMATDVAVKGAVKDVKSLEELTSLFEHGGGDELGRDFLELIVRDAHIVVGDDVGSLGRETTLKVEGDGSVEVGLTFLDFGSLSLLVGVNQPLEIVFLELTDIRVILLLSDLDGLIPSVELLVHSHSLFNLIVLEEDCLSSVELLVEHGKLGLHSEVLKALSANQLVDLSKVIGLSDVTEGSIASLSNIKVLLLHG